MNAPHRSRSAGWLASFLLDVPRQSRDGIEVAGNDFLVFDPDSVCVLQEGHDLDDTGRVNDSAADERVMRPQCNGCVTVAEAIRDEPPDFGFGHVQHHPTDVASGVGVSLRSRDYTALRDRRPKYAIDTECTIPRYDFQWCSLRSRGLQS